jgi:hypothetical protein
MAWCCYRDTDGSEVCLFVNALICSHCAR